MIETKVQLQVDGLTEFQARAASVAIGKLLYNSHHFNICDLDSIAKTLRRENELSGPDYQALRSLHCIDWGDMDKPLQEMVREKCKEILGLHSVPIPCEVVEEPTKPRSFWRLK